MAFFDSERMEEQVHMGIFVSRYTDIDDRLYAIMSSTILR